MPSTTDVQSDAGEVQYRVEFHEPAVKAAEGEASFPRERESSRSPAQRVSRGRSSSVGHRGHDHLGQRAATPEGASSLRATGGYTPGASSWTNVGTPAGVGYPSTTSTPMLRDPRADRPDEDVDVGAPSGQTAEAKLDLLIASMSNQAPSAPPPSQERGALGAGTWRAAH